MSLAGGASHHEEFQPEEVWERLADDRDQAACAPRQACGAVLIDNEGGLHCGVAGLDVPDHDIQEGKLVREALLDYLVKAAILRLRAKAGVPEFRLDFRE